MRKKIIIKFKSMKLREDKRTVEILGDYNGKEVIIELSVLQLAKFWNTDKEVLKKLEKSGWGSEELEDECKETRELVEKYPNIKVEWKPLVIKPPRNGVNWNKEKDIMCAWAIDISGWKNEGIGIIFPLPLYPEELDNEFIFSLFFDRIELEILDKRRER